MQLEKVSKDLASAENFDDAFGPISSVSYSNKDVVAGLNRRWLFSRVRDISASDDAPINEALGTIVVAIYRVGNVQFRPMLRVDMACRVKGWHEPSTIATEDVHNKALSHIMTFGPEYVDDRTSTDWSCQAFDCAADMLPYATFVFKYRTEGKPRTCDLVSISPS